MRRKLLIELIAYIIVAIVGIFLLLTNKHEQTPARIPSDYSITQEDKNDAFIPVK